MCVHDYRKKTKILQMLKKQSFVYQFQNIFVNIYQHPLIKLTMSSDLCKANERKQPPPSPLPPPPPHPHACTSLATRLNLPRPLFVFSFVRRSLVSNRSSINARSRNTMRSAASPPPPVVALRASFSLCSSVGQREKVEGGEGWRKGGEGEG